MSIFSQWPSWRRCVGHVHVAVLDVFLQILKIMSLLLAIMVFLVDRYTVQSNHAREQWRKQERN